MGRLFIIGAGGHGCVLAEQAGDIGSWESIIMLDDHLEKPRLPLAPPVSGRTDQLREQARSGDCFLVGVGENRVRLELLRSLRCWCTPGTLVSRDAYVSPSCTIGAGSVVMPGAMLQAGCVTGEACIINTGAIVEHGCTLGDGVHLSSGAALGGEVVVGAGSWLGVGSSVVNRVEITEDVVVGAGAVVVDPIDQSGTYAGVPARRLDRPQP